MSKPRNDAGKLKVDHTGKRFGRLLVLNFDGFHRYSVKGKPRQISRSMWRCKCDCGKEIVTRGDALSTSKTTSCGCYAKDKTIASNHKRKLPDGGAAMNTLFGKYKEGAIERGLSFLLTLAEFKDNTKQNCHYCGRKPRQIIKNITSTYTYNGIDRVNNLMGYEVTNIVPCCKICNRAKSDMTYDAFKDWLNDVRSFKLKIQPFYLNRITDITGTSGVGIVAIGVELPSGKCVLEWLSDEITETIFQDIDQVKRLHGHNGSTEIILGNPPNPDAKPKRKKKTKTEE
jgi:hypothetical protein